jgi:tetratricopeptide (TPR) repeat protein
MVRLILLSLSLSVFILGACSSRSSIKLKSTPEEAVVSAVETDGSFRIIGKTPLETSESMQSILIEKEGFESARIFIGRLNSQNYEYSIKLTPKADDPKLTDIKSRYERLAKSIAKANNLINKKRYVEAESLLINLTNDYPNVSVGYDLLGNISYMQKDFRKAINHYQRSLELNPENSETKQVLDRLRSMTN